MTIKGLFIYWVVFWTALLGSAWNANSQKVARITKNLEEVTGIIESKRRYSLSQTPGRSMGRAEDRWRHEAVIVYGDNRRWQYSGRSSAPGEVGDEVALLVDPRSNTVYFRDRLSAKGSLLLYLLGWGVVVGLPLGLAKLLGLLGRPHSAE